MQVANEKPTTAFWRLNSVRNVARAVKAPKVAKKERRSEELLRIMLLSKQNRKKAKIVLLSLFLNLL